MTTLERFEAKFVKETSGHWRWIAALFAGYGGGYGLFWYNGTNVGAHRVSWMLYRGPIPEGMQVLHKNECHHRWCVNPDCLYLGTSTDNSADVVASGIRRIKLNYDDVVCIKKMLRDNQPLWLIAWIYQITKCYIRQIRRGQHWSQVAI